MRPIFQIILFLAMVGLFFPFLEYTAQLIVPDNYPTITDAVIASQSGDTIFVKNGVYNVASSEIFPLQLKTDTTLAGESQNGTILESDSATAIQLILVSGVAIKNLTLKYGGLAITNSSNCKLTDSVITSITGDPGGTDICGWGGDTVYGVRIRSFSGNTSQGNVIVNNRIDTIMGGQGGQYGIDGCVCPDCSMFGFTIYGNPGGNAYGINITGSLSTGNLFKNNSLSSIYGGSGGSNFMFCSGFCTFIGGDGGDGWGIYAASPDNTFYQNEITTVSGGFGGSGIHGFGMNGRGYALQFQSADNCKAKMNIITGADYGAYLTGSSTNIDFGDTAGTGAGENWFFGNSQWDFYNASSSVIAQGNWWGCATTAEMDAEGYPSDIQKIYEGGGVDYQFWLQDAPVNSLAATKNISDVLLSWSAYDLTLNYEYRRGEIPDTLGYIAPADTSSTATDTGAVNATEDYYYRVFGICP